MLEGEQKLTNKYYLKAVIKISCPVGRTMVKYASKKKALLNVQNIHLILIPITFVYDANKHPILQTFFPQKIILAG